jgi:hypothetical protein
MFQQIQIRDKENITVNSFTSSIPLEHLSLNLGPHDCKLVLCIVLNIVQTMYSEILG